MSTKMMLVSVCAVLSLAACAHSHKKHDCGGNECKMGQEKNANECCMDKKKECSDCADSGGKSGK